MASNEWFHLSVSHSSSQGLGSWAVQSKTESADMTFFTMYQYYMTRAARITLGSFSRNDISKQLIGILKDMYFGRNYFRQSDLLWTATYPNKPVSDPPTAQTSLILLDFSFDERIGPQIKDRKAHSPNQANVRGDFRIIDNQGLSLTGDIEVQIAGSVAPTMANSGGLTFIFRFRVNKADSAPFMLYERGTRDQVGSVQIMFNSAFKVVVRYFDNGYREVVSREAIRARMDTVLAVSISTFLDSFVQVLFSINGKELEKSGQQRDSRLDWQRGQSANSIGSRENRDILWVVSITSFTVLDTSGGLLYAFQTDQQVDLAS